MIRRTKKSGLSVVTLIATPNPVLWYFNSTYWLSDEHHHLHGGAVRYASSFILTAVCSQAIV